MACSAHNACLRRSISQRAMSSHYLQGLNDAQLKAVQHPPDIPLQIHAGPGTGKTKVLTSRVAYLIDHYGLRPDRICAVTFTRTAAREMSARLVTLIGDRRAREVRLGTFHSVAAKELKKHASVVGLKSDFELYNPADCTTVMSLPVQVHAQVLERCNVSLEDGYSMFYELISKAKGKGLTAEAFREQGISLTAEHFRLEDREEYMRELHNSAHSIFKQYETILRRYNALDFDDLIIYYERLLAENPTRCDHLLVDEFQDTSILQYEMTRGILQQRKALTTVGDPDQSIYGWRDAEVGNLKRMQTDYPDTVQIRLEQNYRSTGKIVKTNMVIIEQEQGRVPKTLISTHPMGIQPVLYTGVENYDDQADFIASEIRRLYEEAGGLLRWEDFAILVRMNYEKKVIQRALEEEGIPYRKSDNYHFLDRPEVVNLLAFLELILPPESIPNLLRAIPISNKQTNMNVIRSVISNPSTFGLSGLELLQRIHDGEVSDVDHSTRQDVGPFLEHMQLLRERTDAGDKPSALILRTLEITNYAQHLENESSNWESAWKNVQQLLYTAAKFEERSKEQNGCRLLSVFLTHLRVITRLRSVSDHGFDNKVTVTTVHAAKGLEWAAVFIPSVVEKTYPAYFSKDVNEERRLLFVASTRAKILLYFVHPRMPSTKAVRGDAAASSGTELTRFLTPLKDDAESYLSSELPSFTEKDLHMISEVLGRPLPDESELVHTVTETITASTGHRKLAL
ncbi:UvrD-helicase-domain-containing protein [Laetiporus sulphureus 93-53]|uniref:DNA 3'-5' helicase n=1 Tax=Laetiporus sulphureus 93-53 TaxID=1314785 RepID=A0A165DAE3_9APHY|nr:UvrD-helicase-domain-containing protein [Laetiporus sulphureus 93-53]KZT04433.1 UvrD-helicase-domain-containing protein [Laetiporus sulphureus 93-53]